MQGGCKLPPRSGVGTGPLTWLGDKVTVTSFHRSWWLRTPLSRALGVGRGLGMGGGSPQEPSKLQAPVLVLP